MLTISAYLHKSTNIVNIMQNGKGLLVEEKENQDRVHGVVVSPDDAVYARGVMEECFVDALAPMSAEEED